MADWYVSSAAYATYTAFQTSHAYIIGNIIVPTAPAAQAKWAFQCTVAGTSSTEPAWTSTNNGTNTSGTATFKNVTGQSSLFWAAAAGDVPTIYNGTHAVAGDRVFISSDHTETQTSSTSYGPPFISVGYGLMQWLSVNRAGATPPVAADLTAGATLTVSGSANALFLIPKVEHYWHGVTFIMTGAGASEISIGDTTNSKAIYFKNCQFYLNNSSTSSLILLNKSVVIFDNTTLQFGNASQKVSVTDFAQLTWVNTPNALAGATFPSTLFAGGSVPTMWVTCRGVDLSALTGTLIGNSNFGGSRYLLDSCKIASGVTRYDTTSVSNSAEEVTLLNCYDGTNIMSEQYTPNGTVTTEFTITLTGGATDDVGGFSHKMVSNANIDKFVYPLCSFWMDVNCATIGASKTATVEIISSATLNNDEIALYLQYEGTAGSSLASFGNSFITTPLTAASAVPSSSAGWNSSPATPQKQHCQVTFTPQQAGRLRGQLRLGKASTTVYYNPQIVLS